MKVRHQFTEAPFPLWAFLHQLLFHPWSKVVWSPMQFWCAYKIQLLEYCWRYDYINDIQFLEHCWEKDIKQM